MQEPGVKVARRRDRDRLENLSDIAAVIAAVRDDVQQYLLARHAPAIAVGELELDDFTEGGGTDVGDVLLVPGVGGRDIRLQPRQARCVLRIRRVERPW